MLAVEAVPRGVPPLGFAAKVAVAILLCKRGQPLVGIGAKLGGGIGGGFRLRLGGLVNYINYVAIAGDNGTAHRTLLNVNAAIIAPKALMVARCHVHTPKCLKIMAIYIFEVTFPAE